MTQEGFCPALSEKGVFDLGSYVQGGLRPLFGYLLKQLLLIVAAFFHGLDLLSFDHKIVSNASYQ